MENTKFGETTKNLEEKKPIEIKISHEKIEYKMILSIIDNEKQLKIEAFLTNSIQLFLYVGLFSLEKMIKLDNFFKSFNSIQEVQDLILKGNEKNKIYISKMKKKRN